MPRGKKYTTEQIIPKLREAELVMSQGTTQELAAKQIGVSAQTLIRWRKEFGGLRMDQAKRLKELQVWGAHFITMITSLPITKTPIFI